MALVMPHRKKSKQMSGRSPELVPMPTFASILWNSPPFDMTPELDGIRTAYNETVEDIAKDNGATYFDVACLLADPSDASKTVYGQHPNDEGGTVIADAFVKLIQE